MQSTSLAKPNLQMPALDGTFLNYRKFLYVSHKFGKAKLASVGRADTFLFYMKMNSL